MASISLKLKTASVPNQPETRDSILDSVKENIAHGLYGCQWLPTFQGTSRASRASRAGPSRASRVPELHYMHVSASAHCLLLRTVNRSHSELAVWQLSRPERHDKPAANTITAAAAAAWVMRDAVLHICHAGEDDLETAPRLVCGKIARLTRDG